MSSLFTKKNILLPDILFNGSSTQGFRLPGKSLFLLLLFLSVSLLSANAAFCEADLFSQEGVCNQDSAIDDCADVPDKTAATEIRKPAQDTADTSFPETPEPLKEKVVSGYGKNKILLTTYPQTINRSANFHTV